MDFNFYMPTKIISGKGCLKSGGETLKEYGSRCIIITGRHSASFCGALADAKEVLTGAGIDYIVYDSVKPNPLLSGCFEAASQARRFRADFVLGIGGGSALDSAKAAAVFAANPNFAPEDIYKRKITKALPIILVGTTAGTGSEVTLTSVLTVDSQNIKQSINDKFLYAKVSFCDPIYTGTCPWDLTVTAALDALCHAIEGFYSKRAGDIARNCAVNAVNLLWPNLLWLRAHRGVTPGEHAREQLYYGSLWAGLTLNLAGTCFPHPAGYPLSTEHGIPHGIACAVFLPDFLLHNAPSARSYTKMLFDVMRCDIDDFCAIVKELADTNHLRLTSGEIEKYTQALTGRRNLTNAIVASSENDVKAIYEKLFL